MSYALADVKLLLVVPCYNEALRFRADSFAQGLAENRELAYVFVNDGSRDATGTVLEEFARAHPGRAVVLPLSRNGGKAEAVRQGFLWSFRDPSATASVLFPWSAMSVSHIGYWDADLATPLTELAAFQRIFAEHPGAQLAMGARVNLLGRSIKRHAHRHYLGRIFATAASLVLRLPVYDTQCGAKIFRYGPATHDLFRQPLVSRWVFDVEILARMRSTGDSRALSPLTQTMPRWAGASSPIHEVPLREWRDVEGSKVKPTDFVKAFVELLRIKTTYR